MKRLNSIGIVVVAIFCCGAVKSFSQENTTKVKKNEVITLEDLPETITIVLLTPREADQLMQEGENAMASKNFSKAIEKFLILTQASEESPDDHYSLAVAYDSAADYSSALKHYQITIQLNPQKADAYSNIGLIYLNELNEPEEAIGFFTTALELQPIDKKASIYITIAQAYHKIGDKENAYSYFKKATAPDVATLQTWTEFGKYEYALGNYNKALHCFTTAKNLVSYWGMCYVNIAKAYEALNDNKNAREQLEWALEYTPEPFLGEVSYYYAMFLIRQFPDERALIKIHLINDLNSVKAHPDSWRQLALLLVDNKDYALLKMTLSRYIAAYEKEPDYLYYLGLAYFNLGDETNGTKYLKTAANMGSDKASSFIKEKKL
jgi:tetratricopeptide (TPR) repeat protein